MTLARHVQRLRSLLRKAQPARDETWAKAICAATREVHEAVWLERPALAFVTGKVLPVLKRAESAVDAMEDARGRRFCANVRFRIRDLSTRYGRKLGAPRRKPAVSFDQLYKKTKAKLERLALAPA